MNLVVWLARAIAVVVLAAVAVFGCLGASAPWSPWGWIVLATLGMAAASVFVRSKIPRWVLRVLAGTWFGVVFLARLVDSGAPNEMIAWPDGTSSRWLGRIVDEQDVGLLGARLLTRRWPLARDEREGLLREMHAAYVEMRDEAGDSPSPVLDTALGRQHPHDFDALLFGQPGPGAEHGPSAAVVFLHGYGGSSRLECWLVAQAARAIGALTVCPAIDFTGHWNSPAGERTLRAALDQVSRQWILRVYLAGLSNGAAGASALAPKFADSLAGLILISGAPAGGTTAGLPTLVVQGEHDPMASAAAARAFAARTHATYVSVDSGHFALLMQRARTRDAIADWLRHQEHSR